MIWEQARTVQLRLRRGAARVASSSSSAHTAGSTEALMSERRSTGSKASVLERRIRPRASSASSALTRIRIRSISTPDETAMPRDTGHARCTNDRKGVMHSSLALNGRRWHGSSNLARIPRNLIPGRPDRLRCNPKPARTGPEQVPFLPNSRQRFGRFSRLAKSLEDCSREPREACSLRTVAFPLK